MDVELQATCYLCEYWEEYTRGGKAITAWQEATGDSTARYGECLESPPRPYPGEPNACGIYITPDGWRGPIVEAERPGCGRWKQARHVIQCVICGGYAEIVGDAGHFGLGGQPVCLACASVVHQRFEEYLQKNWNRQKERALHREKTCVVCGETFIGHYMATCCSNKCKRQKRESGCFDGEFRALAAEANTRIDERKLDERNGNTDHDAGKSSE